MGTYNRCVKTDLKFSTVCQKCQKTAGRGGFFWLTLYAQSRYAPSFATYEKTAV